jgi:hypothetical protein
MCHHSAKKATTKAMDEDWQRERRTKERKAQGD